MRLAFLITSFICMQNATMIYGYQDAKKIIQDELVDNNTEEVGIRSQLTEEEAEEIQIFLKEKGISSQKKKTTSDQVNHMSQNVWGIFVSPLDTVDSIFLLEKAGLPKRKKTSIFEEFIHRIRQGYTMSEDQAALAKQLEKYVEEQQGVVNAEVVIKFDNDPFTHEEVIKTLLYIRHTGTLDDPHSELANQIKKHFLDNIHGLKEDRLIFVTERETPVEYHLPQYEN